MTLDPRHLTGKIVINGKLAGTAWRAGPTTAITAAHCLRIDPIQQKYHESCKISFNDDPISTVAKVRIVDGKRCLDEKLDVAILDLDRSSQNFAPLMTPAWMNAIDEKWTSYGYPDAKPDGMGLSGTITHVGERTGRGIQLLCAQGGAGNLMHSSGSPVIVRGHAVGLIVWNPKTLLQKVIFARTLDVVATEFPSLKVPIHQSLPIVGHREESNVMDVEFRRILAMQQRIYEDRDPSKFYVRRVWDNFQTHGQAPPRAFEAFAGLLFERWIRRDRAQDLDHVTFIKGAGDDGGVEAIAFYADGSMRGLQAKWFRTALESSELGQMRASIEKALVVYPQLVEYVVALPRDLAHPERVPKEGQRELQTERDRWDALVQEIHQLAPQLTLTLWDGARLSDLLDEVGSYGLTDYWFAGSVIRLDNLRLRFEQARSGWLLKRYIPDFHTAGQIEADLHVRIAGLRIGEQEEREFEQVDLTLHAAAAEVKRLRRFPFFETMRDGEAIIQHSLAAIDAARVEQRWLVDVVRQGTTIPRTAPPKAPIAESLFTLLSAIPEQNVRGIDPTKDLRERIEDAQRVWLARSLTRDRLANLQRPVIYVGEPGSGKTHAMTSMVERQLLLDAPALLVRARDHDASANFQALLRDAIGQPTWNQVDVLDACEASAALVHVTETAKLPAGQRKAPTRFLLAVDGLDESPNANQWGARLGEVIPLTTRWPRICFAFSLRSSLLRELDTLESYSRLHVHHSDADLATLFYRYTSESRIRCPPILRWALRTPLAISLFAELYEGQEVDFDTSAFTLETLIDKKLDRVEASLREIAPKPWDPQLQPVRRSLLGLVHEYVKNPRRLTDAEASAAALSEQTGFASLDAHTVGWILEKLRDYGLLLVQMWRDSKLAPQRRTWEPAFEALTDFLLADEAKRQIEADQGGANMPAFLRQRPDAAAVAIALLGSVGFDRLADGLWTSDLSPGEHERLQRVALLNSRPHAAATTWAREQFVRSMPSCRLLLAELIVPSLRLPNRGFGGMFVHNVLVEFSVQMRDQFWSVPYWLPPNHGAPWEGFGPELDKLLEIDDDDSWDGMPLIAAWMLTSCNNSLRRQVRRRLAKWAASKPEQLCRLLEHAGRTNDPQMLEDLLWITLGAAYLSEVTIWHSVCNWVTDSAAAFHAVSPWNIEIAHCRRAIVEYIAYKTLYARQLIEVPTDASLLPLDTEAAKAMHKPMRVGPFDWDLVAYVITQAYEPFFTDLLRLQHRATSTQPDVGIESIPQTILQALADGAIRPDASNDNKEHARNELLRRQAVLNARNKQSAKRRQEQLQFIRLFVGLPAEAQEELRTRFNKDGHGHNLLDRMVEMLGQEAGLPPETIAQHSSRSKNHTSASVQGTRVSTSTTADAAGLTDGETVSEHVDPDKAQDDEVPHQDQDEDDATDDTPDEYFYETKGSPDLVAAITAGDALLKAHADSINFPSLAAEQLAYGYCQFRVLELGWNEAIHHKDPRGEQPGEVLGLDVAILRRYPQARHGERSRVSTMVEKYCWIARHELVGYLARRLPARCGDALLPSPVDPAHFVETPCPATDEMRPYAELQWPTDPFRQLAPKRSDIGEMSQLGMANEWVTSTPPPDIDSILHLSGELLPKELYGHEWVVLYAGVTREDAETMGQSVLWCCAFATTDSDVPTLVEDTCTGQVSNLHEFHAGLDKIEFYSDPSEVVWASWIKETYDVRRHSTVDQWGSPCEVQLRALSCTFYWKNSEGSEEELSMPSKWLLECMGVTHVRSGRFCRRDNTVAAIVDSNGVVLARTDLVMETLRSLGMSLCWGVRVYREPNTLLFSESEEFKRWNWHALAVCTAANIESHTIARGIEK